MPGKNRKARHYHVGNKGTASCAYGVHIKQSHKLFEGNETVFNRFNRELFKLSRSSLYFEAQWLLLQTGKCINLDAKLLMRVAGRMILLTLILLNYNIGKENSPSKKFRAQMGVPRDYCCLSSRGDCVFGRVLFCKYTIDNNSMI